MQAMVYFHYLFALEIQSRSWHMASCKCSLYHAHPKTYEDLENRVAVQSQIVETLTQLAFDAHTWMEVYRCTVCGTLWASEVVAGSRYDSERCFYTILVDNPEMWLRTAQPFTDMIVLEHEDKQFYQSLGAEFGPEMCRHENCSRKRIDLSVMCRLHHFEMVEKRPYLYEDEDLD